MRVPRVRGIIRRRLLVNFRVDPDVMSRHLPAAFQPKIHNGYAIAGICLIRLEQIRLPAVPAIFGLSSENAAHRVAVVASDSQDAVFVPRRDSDSWLNHVIGGRLFPGVQHRARFDVSDDGCRIDLEMRSVDGQVSVEVAARAGARLPDGSVFASTGEASRFFERGALGYSLTRDPERFDGVILTTHGWSVAPLDVTSVASSYFDDRRTFPEGSVVFDHALIMRDLSHEWQSAEALCGAGALGLSVTV